MRPLVLATLVALAAGCTYVRPAPLATAAGRAEVNDRASGRAAVLTFADGSRVEAWSARVAADSVTWAAHGGRGGAAPTTSLIEVRVVDRGRGGVEGAGLGAAVGSGVGLVLGALAETVGGGSGFVPVSPAEGIALSTLAFGAVGAGVGLVGGFDRGTQIVYLPTIHPAPPPRE